MICSQSNTFHLKNTSKRTKKKSFQITINLYQRQSPDCLHLYLAEREERLGGLGLHRFPNERPKGTFMIHSSVICAPLPNSREQYKRILRIPLPRFTSSAPLPLRSSASAGAVEFFLCGSLSLLTCLNFS